jgi:hypothetical protein
MGAMRDGSYKVMGATREWYLQGDGSYKVMGAEFVVW